MTNSSPYDEKAVLTRVAEGDENAFTELFLHWHQTLAGYIYRITESQELMEEIVQDAFMKIWMSRETLTEIRNFKYYLLAVSRNQALDVLKRNLREDKLKRSWMNENINHITTENIDIETSKNSIIDEAIDNLPPRRKEVFLLSRHERLTYAEIASRLDISKESVKTHVKLASGSITNFIRSRLIGIAGFIWFLKDF